MAAFRSQPGRRLKRLGDATLGTMAVSTLKAIRWIDPDAASNFAGRMMRRLGPLLPEHRIGRNNLRAAFPEKSDEEREAILRGAWDNLGRVGAEFAHIDRLWDYDPARPGHGRIMDLTPGVETIRAAIESKKPLLCFTAHLANWELAAVGCHSFGLDTTLLYRRPNVGAVSDAVIKMRAGCMGTLIPTGLSAPLQLAAALERGSHVGMLVDQYYVQGVPVVFFGRRTMANPLMARLARQIDCALYGVRVIRHPNNRFDIKVTEEIPPVRDRDGRVDIQGTMQAITTVVEGWVREHPEQWLWLHRRWRDGEAAGAIGRS